LTFFLFILTNEESEFNLNKKTLDSIYSLKVKPKIIETIYTNFENRNLTVSWLKIFQLYQIVVLNVKHHTWQTLCCTPPRQFRFVFQLIKN